jgi:hypothetical protein
VAVEAQALGVDQVLGVDPMALMDPMDQEAVALGAVPVAVLGVGVDLAALVLMEVGVDRVVALGLMAVDQVLGAGPVLGVDPMALMDPMDQEAVALGAVPVAVLGVGVDLAALVLMEVGVDRVVALGLMAVDQVLGAGPVLSPASAKVLANGSGSRLLKNG